MRTAARRAPAPPPPRREITCPAKLTRPGPAAAARRDGPRVLRGDSRLVAAVQRAAGAMAHEAARLLHTYSLWVELHHRATAAGDGGLAEEARREVRSARRRLRAFLTDARTETPDPPGGAAAA